MAQEMEGRLGGSALLLGALPSPPFERCRSPWGGVSHGLPHWHNRHSTRRSQKRKPGCRGLGRARRRWWPRMRPGPLWAITTSGPTPWPSDPLEPSPATWWLSAAAGRGSSAAASASTPYRRRGSPVSGLPATRRSRSGPGLIRGCSAPAAAAPAVSNGLRSTNSMGLNAGVIRRRWLRCLSSAARCSGSSAPLRADCGAPGCAAFALASH